MTGTYTNDLLKDKHPLDRSVVIHYPNGAHSVANEAATLSFPSRQSVGNQDVSFRDVLVSDNIKNTVLSVAKICDTGAVVAFCKTHAVILKKNAAGVAVPVWTVPRVDNLYKVDMDIPSHTVDLTDCPDNFSEVNLLGIEDLLKVEPPVNGLVKLHYCLGHVNEYSLKKAIANDSLIGVSKDLLKESIGKCIICDAAKLRKKPHPKLSKNRATEVLDRFVADTSGLQSTATPAGYRGYSVIVDEMSGYVDVLLIKHKNEVQHHIKNFRALAENKHGKKLKCFRSDNAKEYVLKKDFVDSLIKDGVRMEQCCAYEHSQNGLAEREIGVLAKLCQTNLEQANAPKQLWGECMKYSALQHVCQSQKHLNFKTPYEIWNGRAPNVKISKPWGCLAIAFIPAQSRKKLESTGVRCLFLGIDSNKKGYRLLSLKDKSVIVTPNVTFYETVFPYKLKTVADYIVSQVVPNGLVDAIKDDLKEVSQETQFDLPVIVDKKEHPLSIADTPKSYVWADIPVTPLPVPQESKKLTSTPTLDVTHLLPKEVIEKPSGSNFITAGKNVTHNDAGMSKWMQGFDPSKKRGPKHKEVNSNAIATPNYFDTLSEDFDRCEDIPDHDNEYCYMMKEGPFTFSQAMSSPTRENYVNAAKRELHSFVKNDVYKLVSLDSIAKEEKIFQPRWVFGQKWDGSYKARLTVNGSRQQKGLHYVHSRADTLSITLLRFMLTLVMLYKMIPFQFDVPNAFLQSPMDKPVYLCQPQGFVDQQNPDWVWKLQKCVYGLKQATLRWRSTFHDFVTKVLCFHEIGYNTCAYLLFDQGCIKSILLVYVDDFILASNSETLYENIVEQLSQKFRVKPLGEIKKYLGMEFVRLNDTIIVHQQEYIEKIISDLNMSNLCPLEIPQPEGITPIDSVSEPHDINMYASVIGKLIWLSICTRPDITFYVSHYASFVSKPTIEAWSNVKCLLRYLNSTKHMGITINSKCEGSVFSCYTDAGHANQSLMCKSISGYIFYFLGSPIIWSSKRIHSVVKSAMEAEYIAMSDAAYEAKYLLMIYNEVFSKIVKVDMFSDNSAAISVSNSSGQVRKVKHLQTRFHIIRQMISEGDIEVRWIASRNNIADIFTKHIGEKKLFLELRDKIIQDFRGAGGC